jgi:hypothetical protein
MRPGQPFDRDAQIALVSDRVAAIHGFGLVPGQFHRDAPRHARAFEIANGGPTHVVGNATGVSHGACAQRIRGQLSSFVMELRQ